MLPFLLRALSKLTFVHVFRKELLTHVHAWPTVMHLTHGQLSQLQWESWLLLLLLLLLELLRLLKFSDALNLGVQWIRVQSLLGLDHRAMLQHGTLTVLQCLISLLSGDSYFGTTCQ